MFLGRRMVHQQVDLALSQFPKGLAAELASDQAPPTRLAFADRMNRALVASDRTKLGVSLDSLNYPKRSLNPGSDLEGIMINRCCAKR